jgi:hypothetical protein
VNRVEIANQHHRVRLECDGTGNTVVKLATALWHETLWHTSDGDEPDVTTFDGRTSWRLCPAPAEDADTGE